MYQTIPPTSVVIARRAKLVRWLRLALLLP